MNSPTISDFHLLKHIVRYIKGTVVMGLTITRNSDFVMKAYSDSDWVGWKKQEDHR